ncbi:MAG TPA: hypothetical protein VIZ18_00640 [Ktedonobacteraceae bacterium]
MFRKPGRGQAPPLSWTKPNPDPYRVGVGLVPALAYITANVGA